MRFSAADTVDPTFVANAKQINAIKGLIIGCVEDPFTDGGNGPGHFELGWGWIANNISAENARVDELLNAGIIWQRRWAEGDYSFGFTREGHQWIAKHFDFPFHEGLEARSDKAVLWASILRETFVPKGPKRVGASMTAKTTTTWVKQISYTPDEALSAIMDAHLAARSGKLPVHSLPAIKAHITRRTVQAA